MSDGGPQQLPLPAPGTSVARQLGANPASARVFFDHRMACVGCALSEFDTLADAARAYGLSLDRFLAELAAAATDGTEADGAPPPPAR